MRTVNYSNSLLICQASTARDSSDPQPHGHSEAIEVIARPRQTIELVPLPHTRSSAILSMRELLPAFDQDSYDPPINSPNPSQPTQTGAIRSQTRHPKARIFADVPFDPQECARAWHELSAFEDRTVDRAFRPRASQLIECFSLLRTRVLDQSDAAEFTMLREIDQLKEALSHERVPPLLLDAVVRHICHLAPDAPVSSIAGAAPLKPSPLEAMRWLGRTLLEAMDRERSHDDGPVLLDTFIDRWRELVAGDEVWEREARLGRVASHLAVLKGGVLRWVDVEAGETEEGVIAAEEGGGADEKGKKRKWAEKFKASGR